MSHTIEQHRRRTPMWVYEKNYRQLLRWLPFGREASPGQWAEAVHGADRVVVRLVENSPYTQVVELRHDFGTASTFLQAVEFHVRLYHDARVAEVIRYQDQRRLRGRYAYPNERMLQPDEKRQTNLLLHDWLDLLRPMSFDVDEICPQTC